MLSALQFVQEGLKQRSQPIYLPSEIRDRRSAYLPSSIRSGHRNEGVGAVKLDSPFSLSLTSFINREFSLSSPVKVTGQEKVEGFGFGYLRK